MDYSEPGWAERLREQVGGVDMAFDGVGGQTGLAAFELVRAGGRFCPFGMASGAFVRVPEGEAARRNVTVVRGEPMTPGRRGRSRGRPWPRRSRGVCAR